MRARLDLTVLTLVVAAISTSGCLALLGNSPSSPGRSATASAPLRTMDETLDEGLRALVRELPNAFDSNQIQTVALLDIVGVTGRITALERLVINRAGGAIGSIGRFRVVERARIDKVREEIKLNLSDVIDQKTAVEAGRLMGADALVIGTSFEQDEVVEIVVRVIASRTGQVISTAALRVAKDRTARTMLAQVVGYEAGAVQPPLQISMFVAARRERDDRLVRDYDVVHSGDRFQVNVQTNADCYFYVVLVEQRGQVQILYPDPDEHKPAQKLRPGPWHRLPSADRWWLLDNRPGVETIYGLASYEPVDLRTLVAQLTEGALGGEIKTRSRGPETELAEEVTLQQRSTRLVQRGQQTPSAPVLVPGSSLRLRGVEKTVDGTTSALVLPESAQRAALSEIVQGYTTAVSAITYVHQ